MNSAKSFAHYRETAVKYYLRHGGTKAAIRYRTSRKSIYKWRERYDGTWQSLLEQSRRPKSHPNEHTEEEKALILRHYARHKDDMIVLWDVLRKKGYKRHYHSLCRVIRKWGLTLPDKRKNYKPKPYQRAEYPGKKLQLDVKFVPSYCVSNGRKYYQYTAIDECTRVVFREMYDEHSTYSSRDFLEKLVKKFPFPIRMIQTDNGTEWTTQLLVKDPTKKTMFERALADMDIIYTRIRVATPRHNGKVERQHRTDEARFYKKMRMYSLEDGRKQLAKYNKWSNNIPKICLDFRSPNEVLDDYLHIF